LLSRKIGVFFSTPRTKKFGRAPTTAVSHFFTSRGTHSLEKASLIAKVCTVSRHTLKMDKEELVKLLQASQIREYQELRLLSLQTR
jgi:hypothetical protein